MKILLRYFVLLCLPLFSLTACSGDDTTAVGTYAYNHTDKSIVSIIINGEGGILHATAHGGGGEVCCVVLPNKWRPGLKATIKWQLDGHWVRDKDGKIVTIDGHDQFVEGEWKERTVDVPQYDDQLGSFQVHFFSHDEVKVVISNFFPGHPQYPLALPKNEGSQ